MKTANIIALVLAVVLPSVSFADENKFEECRQKLLASQKLDLLYDLQWTETGFVEHSCGLFRVTESLAVERGSLWLAIPYREGNTPVLCLWNNRYGRTNPQCYRAYSDYPCPESWEETIHQTAVLAASKNGFLRRWWPRSRRD